MTAATAIFNGRPAVTTTELCFRLGIGTIPVPRLKGYGAIPAHCAGPACYWYEADVPHIAMLIAAHLADIAASYSAGKL